MIIDIINHREFQESPVLFSIKDRNSTQRMSHLLFFCVQYMRRKNEHAERKYSFPGKNREL